MLSNTRIKQRSQVKKKNIINLCKIANNELTS